MCVNERDSFLTETLDSSGHAHTSDYPTQLAENSIKLCEEKLKCRVGNVVTYNAANMTKEATVRTKAVK